MRFDLNDYQDRYVAMHCPTNDNAKVFLKLLRDHGRTWNDGSKYNLAATYHGAYKRDTVYYFNNGSYGSRRNAESRRRLVLNFDDFYWGEGVDPMEIIVEEDDDVLFDEFLLSFVNKTTVS